ncbi:MAG: hypothetical protein QNI91_15685 [Arenicellales bacterium]|nr:hypothetical protein [Arenicellales bacterium]
MMIRLVALAVTVFCALPVYAETFKKCQDADGNWHYGDQAAQECELSRITEIDGSGTHLNEIEAPLTEEELAARERMNEKLAEQKRMEAEKKALDQRLLVTYDSDESIIRTRDALLNAIDSGIEADQTFRERLDEELADAIASGVKETDRKVVELRLQIEEYDKSIRDRLAARELARERYDLELSRYQELTK